MILFPDYDHESISRLCDNDFVSRLYDNDSMRLLVMILVRNYMIINNIVIHTCCDTVTIIS